MQDKVIEAVTFRLVEGADSAAFVKAAEATMPFVRGLSGFLGRTLSMTEGGDWLDHVEWASLADARAAAKSFGADESVKPFIRMIDMGSVTMRHYHVASDMAG